MDGLTTEEIMKTALGLVGWDKVPPDSGIHVVGAKIRSVIFTMDVNVGLLHTAKSMKFDAVIGHHPCGVLYKRGELYRRHIELLEQNGIAKEKILSSLGQIIEKLIRSSENRRFRMLYNECPNQTVLEVDAAKLLGLPFMNVHSPLDELGRRILQSKIDEAERQNPSWRLKEVLKLVEDLPEVNYAKNVHGIKPKIYVGHPDTEPGKVVFVHGALSAPSSEIVQFYWQNGIKTVIALHAEFESLERMKESSEGNLILTGHFAGDSIGFTPFIRSLRKQGIEVRCMGGVIDISDSGVS